MCWPLLALASSDPGLSYLTQYGSWLRKTPLLGDRVISEEWITWHPAGNTSIRSCQLPKNAKEAICSRFTTVERLRKNLTLKVIAETQLYHSIKKNHFISACRNSQVQLEKCVYYCLTTYQRTENKESYLGKSIKCLIFFYKPINYRGRLTSNQKPTKALYSACKTQWPPTVPFVSQPESLLSLDLIASHFESEW